MSWAETLHGVLPMEAIWAVFGDRHCYPAYPHADAIAEFYGTNHMH